MLIRFSSIKTEPITMFGDNAMQLIKMLGASSAVPGAIGADDIAQALARLRQQLQIHTAANPAPLNPDKSDDDEKGREPPISLATRATPLIEILERASTAHAPVMWEKL